MLGLKYNTGLRVQRSTVEDSIDCPQYGLRTVRCPQSLIKSDIGVIIIYNIYYIISRLVYNGDTCVSPEGYRAL